MNNTPPVLTCPHDPAFECRFVGDALPPDGAQVVDDPARRCPPGYLPYRKREAVVLEGKRVVTVRPAERRPASPGAGASDADAAKSKPRKP